VIENRGHASSKEQIERLIETKIDAVTRQHLREAAATQHLAVDQDAVAVENDEIGLGHRRSAYANSALRESICSLHEQQPGSERKSSERKGPGPTGGFHSVRV